MPQDKQALLKRHRKQKRLLTLLLFFLLAAAAFFYALWLFPVGLFLVWLLHEAYFSDHLFYSAKQDYQYQFEQAAEPVSLDKELDITYKNKTLLLKIKLKSTLLGHFFDPYVLINDDKQSFERGAKGVRYLNLTGQFGAVTIKGRFCRLAKDALLYPFEPVDLENKTLLILAPHADDAEIAAFALYQKYAQNTAIVTITQGEIEAQFYQKRFALDQAKAAQLKGRLRSFDSRNNAAWGGVASSACVQLGYYCLRLKEMQQAPSQAFPSKESQQSDIRLVREAPFELPSDKDGLPTWQNLVADLAACLDYFKPDIVLTPHPELDPHSDHRATTQAFFAALKETKAAPQTALFYANHLADNDRWPMGNSGDGVALPPWFEKTPSLAVFSYSLDKDTQVDKALALALQHDLQTPLPPKKLLRRYIQRVLVGRRWPDMAADEFQRKAVRRHELFWVSHVARRD